jgi:hypothetical protein
MAGCVLTTEESKAVGELAKTAGKALDIVRATGGWLESIFGTLPEDIIGLVGADWLHEKRRRIIAKLQINTAQIIAELPISDLTEPSPSVVLPLLQFAADESRPELQARWAALLANAMTDGGRKVRRAFFETLAKMEPTDAVLLDVLTSGRRSRTAPNSSPDNRSAVCECLTGAVASLRTRFHPAPDRGRVRCLSETIPTSPPRFAVAAFLCLPLLIFPRLPWHSGQTFGAVAVAGGSIAILLQT